MDLYMMANALRVGEHLLERLDAHVDVGSAITNDPQPLEVAR